MITPWSTNAVEIAENMDIEGIQRIEHFVKADKDQSYDKMLQSFYPSLGQDLFRIDKKPDPIIEIKNIEEFNRQEGLALSVRSIGTGGPETIVADLTGRIVRIILGDVVVEPTLLSKVSPLYDQR